MTDTKIMQATYHPLTLIFNYGTVEQSNTVPLKILTISTPQMQTKTKHDFMSQRLENKNKSTGVQIFRLFWHFLL